MLHFYKQIDDGTEKWGHRIMCYENLVIMYEVLDRGGFFLESLEDAQTMLKCTEQFLLHYHSLSIMHPDGERYKETPKFHTLYHIVLFFAKYLSPKVACCYMFEEFIGKIQELGKACVHATPMHHVP